MTPKLTPFTKDEILAMAKEHPTPFYVYDEAGFQTLKF